MYTLAKAFVNDPEATLQAIAQELGKDIDALVSGGAFDKGQVIGSYVSPAMLAKVASKVSHLAKALPDTKSIKTGCSSFAAGTSVWTPDGLRAIETLKVGDLVLARNDESFFDTPRPITQLMNREVAYHYSLSTGDDEIQTTEEHPFWRQGKGWVEAQHLKVGNAIAVAEGDLLVRKIERVEQPLRVYNFTVEGDHTYFVGPYGLWVHNANDTCDLAGTVGKHKEPAKVANMKEFFQTEFGGSLAGVSQKTSKIYKGQAVYTVSKKAENPYLKKGDQFYLDSLHYDHIEVFDKQGKVKAVINLNGTLNEAKTAAAIKSGRELK